MEVFFKKSLLMVSNIVKMSHSPNMSLLYKTYGTIRIVVQLNEHYHQKVAAVGPLNCSYVGLSLYHIFCIIILY